MSQEEEFDELLRINPDVLQSILLFKIYKRMDKLGAFLTFMGPMTRMFKRDLQYQYETVPAGGYRTVWFMRNPQPELLVGVITQVANDWFADTYLEWFIDHKPKRVEYVIGDVENPKEYERGIPFYRQVKWVAHNNSDEEHTFGVLVDGFWMPKKLFNKIVR